MFDINNKIYEIYTNLKGEFERWKVTHKNNYDYYNILEKRLVAMEEITEQESCKTQGCDQDLFAMMQKIKSLAMELQRNNPTEWNNFFDAALS